MKESCGTMAHARTSKVQGGFADGGCSNGLGFPADGFDGPVYADPPTSPPTQIAWECQMVSTGTRYKLQAGGTVVVSCSPSAWAETDLGGMGAVVDVSVWYASEILAPRIKLTGVTRITGATPAEDVFKVIAGQQVKAEIECPGLAVVPGSHCWMVLSDDAAPFKDYVATEGEGRKDELDAQTSTPALTFYTNGNGVAEITCSLRFVPPEGTRFEGGLPHFALDSQ